MKRLKIRHWKDKVVVALKGLLWISTIRMRAKSISKPANMVARIIAQSQVTILFACVEDNLYQTNNDNNFTAKLNAVFLMPILGVRTHSTLFTSLVMWHASTSIVSLSTQHPSEMTRSEWCLSCSHTLLYSWVEYRLGYIWIYESLPWWCRLWNDCVTLN